MDLHLLPDIVALGVLLALLRLLIRRHPESRVDLWFSGLLLILGEEIAHLLYTIPGPWHIATHVAALVCYLFAGTVFIFASLRRRLGGRPLALSLAISTVPRLAALVLYGLGVQTPRPYYLCALLGIIVGMARPSILPSRLRYVFLPFGVWGIFAVAVSRGGYRFSAYWLLFYLFSVTAVAFWSSLPRTSLGRYAIVIGFGLWSLCFLTHSLAVQHPFFLPVADNLWDLQKFLVAFGMLMVLLEDQVARNRELALHDELTGLPNRRLFDDRLAQALLQGSRGNTRTGLFLLDLNGFKQINDRLGHEAGDRLLCNIAESLARVVRSSDTLARLGGDEFAIIVANFHHIQPLTGLIEEAISKPLVLNGESYSVTASVGLAIAPADSLDPEALCRLADARMYAHKGRPVPYTENPTLQTSL